MRVALFVPCFVDALAPRVAEACVSILRRVGCEVVVPRGQTCCGQPALNTGYFDEARRLARRHLQVLARARPDAVVAPSGSCVSALTVEARARLDVDHPLLDRCFELSSFLVDELGVTDVGATFRGRVTWHDACHAARALGIRDAPRRLLGAVRGLELVEMPASDECCGFGGTFAVKRASVSTTIGRRKVRRIVESGARWVASTEPSCLLQIGGILARTEHAVRTIHLAEILAARGGPT